ENYSQENHEEEDSHSSVIDEKNEARKSGSLKDDVLIEVGILRKEIDISTQ
ncbi:hypothetical protein AVEN_268038-1, partial [Araneus ventricosus]